MRRLVVLVVAALATLVAACSSPSAAPAHTLVVGGGDDPLQQVIAEIYRGALAHTGVRVSDEVAAGNTAALLTKMTDGSVDLQAVFSGSTLHQLDPKATAKSSDDVYDALNRALPQGVYAGDRTPVKDTPAVYPAAPGITTVTSLADCRQVGGIYLVTSAARLAVARSDYAGPCPNFNVVTADQLPEMYWPRYLSERSPLGDADAGGRPPALADNGGYLTTEDLLPIYRGSVFGKKTVVAMNNVAGELSSADLSRIVGEVAAKKATARQVADRWLGEHGL